MTKKLNLLNLDAELRAAASMVAEQYTAQRLAELAEDDGVDGSIAKFMVALEEPEKLAKIAPELSFLLKVVGVRLGVVSMRLPRVNKKSLNKSAMPRNLDSKINSCRAAVRALEKVVDLGELKVTSVTVRYQDENGKVCDIWYKFDEEVMLECARIVKGALMAQIRSMTGESKKMG